MVDILVSSVRVLAALLLVGLNGFFVASEFAFVRVRSTAVNQLAAEGRPGASTLQEVTDQLDDYLAATQLGITIASLGLGWIGEPAVAALLEPVLGAILPETLLHIVAFALGFSIITFLHVVFGELAPKTIAIAQAERLALLLAPPMKVAYYLFIPGIVVFNTAANKFVRLLGVPPASETEETLEEREIRRVLTRSREAGNVDPAEVDMIQGVFDLDDTVVREVMIPHPDVVSISADQSLDELRELVGESGHTRYPVTASDDPDQVIGFIDVKDILTAEDTTTSPTAGDLARDIIIVPEMTTISDLLVQFRDEQQQMAAVIDEWGAFEGIATVEDVVEAVVGDIRDEFDTDAERQALRQHEDETYTADGSVPLSAVNDTLDTNFTGEGYETLGGFVLDQLGRTPQRGDTVTAAGYEIRITAVDGTRISKLRISMAE